MIHPALSSLTQSAKIDIKQKHPHRLRFSCFLKIRRCEDNSQDFSLSATQTLESQLELDYDSNSK